MNDTEKVVGLLVQSAGNLVQGVKQVQVRLARVAELQARGGEFGPVFWSTYLLPQYLYRILLSLTTLVGVLALLGGVLTILNSAWGGKLQSFFQNHWLEIFGIGLLLGLIALIDGLSLLAVALFAWMPQRWLPNILRSVDWFNLLQFCNLLEKPRPLVLRQLGIDSVADTSIARLISGDYKTENFAEKPGDLSPDERANVALFGCLLEQEHYVRRWKYRKWRPFYDALSKAKHDGRSIFAPDYVVAARRNAQDFYTIIRDTVNPLLLQVGQAPLDDTAAVSDDVTVAADTLAAQFKGSAANLAKVDLQGMDLSLAFDRLSLFRHLSGPGMGPQFLKLAVRWDVWPGIATGNFVYPFSTSIATLLLDQEALVTLGEVTEFSLNSTREQAVVREAMMRTVNTVERLLTSVDREDYKTVYQSLSSTPDHPAQWELAQRVDFILWSAATEQAKTNSFSNWRIGSNKFVSRKKSDA